MFTFPVGMFSADEITRSGNDSNTKLLIHSNTTNGSTTFVDSSIGGGRTITPGGNTNHSSTYAKFGATSIYFDGAGDRLSMSSSGDFAYSSDFCVDLWMYITAQPSGNEIIMSSSTSGGLAISYNNTNGLQLGRSLIDVQVGAGSSVTTDAWHHMCAARKSGTVYLYHDGIYQNSSSISTSYGAGTTYLGVDGNGSSFPMNGYFDEYRISNGSARVDDSNDPLYISSGTYTDGFTPPTSPYV